MTQDEQSRVQRIKEYVLARLREELGNAPRGAQARLAKALGVSGAHLSNMLSPNPTRQPGEDFRRKVAVHWGISYAQLEALALGESPPESTRLGIVSAFDEVPRNLAGVLSEYSWMHELPSAIRVIVREQARQHHRFTGNDFSREEWQRIVTGLEREALSLVAWRMKSTVPPALEDGETPSKSRHVRTKT